MTIMDTPGHVDFSAEMERTLQILDYAILLINGTDGIQGHVFTLWKLLARYNIPTFIFVNKMDQSGTDRGKLLTELRERLSEHCLPFDVPQDEKWKESIAMCSESLLEQYLNTGDISPESIKTAIANRLMFPCIRRSLGQEFLRLQEMKKGIV